MPVREDARAGRVHLILAVAAAALFFVLCLIVDADEIDPWEVDVTRWINDAPAWLDEVLWPIMQLGTFWAPIVIAIAAAYVWGIRRALAVLASGVAAWFLAKVVKDAIERGRPPRYIPDIDVREGSGAGLGFVSGHTAVAFAIATALLPVLPRWGRVTAYALATVVGVARLVYGVHFPLDVVGGACLGIMCGCVVELVLLAVPASRAPAG
ncbi:MAG: phosphatase PAP2 family protein [Acidimicrobiia bacterium]